jgi:glycosyltransferase involved in cell wall biosynthesis
VTTTGRAHPYKRFDFIIKCAEALRNKSSDLDIAFLLVGDGPAMADLREMVTNLKLDNTVRLLGFREDVRDLLCASDLALHAALGEGFSLSIIEYMSAGLPVLVPDIPSVSQATTHNNTGIIYPKDDPETVANFLIDLATNSKHRLEMGKKAKSIANTTYNLDQCTQSFVDAIETGFSWV